MVGMRAERAGGVELQVRDIKILVDLFACRLMSLRHICDLFFDGKMEAAKKRVQKLKAAGLVRERPRRIGDPSILHLTKKAFLALKNGGYLDSFPEIGLQAMEKRAQVSDLTVRHELGVMDVRTAFIAAVRKTPNLEVREFGTWPALYQFTAQHISPAWGRRFLLVKPDAFILTSEKNNGKTFERLFFLESDRSTEVQTLICQKATCYLDFYQKGGMAQRFGACRESYREFPFRLLLIFRTEERRNNAAEALLNNTPPILSLAWLSTTKEVLSDPLGAVWLLPSVYRDAVAETPFDASWGNQKGTYRRQAERDNLVRKKATLRSAFTDSSETKE